LSCVFILFQGVSADKVSNNHSSLPTITIFKAYNYHSVATETPSPAIDTVFLIDAARHVQFVVASHANVVIAEVALETVVASVDGWDRASADVAKSREAKRPED
jgi:hypothetical protein